MQLYEAATQKTTTAAAGHIVTLVAASTSRPDIREIGVFVSSAAAITIGLGRPAAVGATPTSILGQALDFNDPTALCSIAATWTTAPTSPSVFMRRISLPGTVGAGVIWTFPPNSFNVPPSGNVTLWQISAVAVTLDFYCQWEE